MKDDLEKSYDDRHEETTRFYAKHRKAMKRQIQVAFAFVLFIVVLVSLILALILTSKTKS